jgi:maltooligosyltrehalose trehalohydrolase
MAASISIDRRTLGVNFNAGKAEILVWAPQCKQVCVLIAGEETIPLTRQERGYWELSTDKLTRGINYQFLLDDETLPDVTSLYQQGGVHEASQAFDLKDYHWSDQQWSNPSLCDYILYELHTGTFTPEGDFQGIEKKLDYLKSLGITAIEIMPVAQFPGERNWGYDGVFPFAVQNSYGGPAALQKLVDACHQKELAVVLDVVYNHMGPEGNYLSKYGPYFTGKYQTPWGDAVNFDDAGRDEVRRFFIENALMWFRDFHIDALRMDAVHAIKDFSPKHILREIKEHVDQLMALTGKQHYLIVECDLNDRRFIDPLTKQGYGMDAQWIDEFHHALRVTAGGNRDGYYADFVPVESLAEAYRHAYVYHGQYSAHRERTFGTVTDNPGNQFIVFSQNHDQVGNRMLGERSSQLFSFEMQKLLVGAVFAGPFIPMLFMGEERSETSPFQYFISHTDPELVAAVQKGRKAEFAAFHTEGETPDPQAQETFDRSKLHWDNLQSVPHSTMLAYYTALIALRKNNPALRSNDRESLNVKCDTNRKLVTLHRRHSQQDVLCLMNFAETVQEVVIPEYIGHGEKLFDSADQAWKGPKSSPQIITQGLMLIIQPQSILIYTQSHV